MLIMSMENIICSGLIYSSEKSILRTLCDKIHTGEILLLIMHAGHNLGPVVQS